MKSYTDIEQSKKLAEFLSLESADCFWDYDEMQKFHRISWFEDGYNKESQLMLNENNVCAWSLAALLGVLPNENMLVKTTDSEYYCLAKDVTTKHYDNPVDACYEMIIRLNELNLLRL